MIVTVASGKGGTGKTTLSASLASVWPRAVAAVDLDVEEPNLDLFLDPRISSTEPAYIEVPVVNPAGCTLCGACVELCQFKAVTKLGSSILIFPEMCHGCGGCLGICPENVLVPGRRELGTVSEGMAGGIHFLSGRLRVGSPPLMRAVLKSLCAVIGRGPTDAIIDAPPGVSCPAVTSVLESDVIVLVAEPTPFGLHDFSLAVEAFAPFQKPTGVVVNRAGLGDDSIHEYCADVGLPILGEIPFDRAIAEAYSRGRVVACLDDRLRDLFAGLADKVLALGREAAHA